jgi:hypothetical protein
MEVLVKVILHVREFTQAIGSDGVALVGDTELGKLR